MDTGFIGLGAMGAEMAGRLAAAGHRVLAWNRSPAEVPEGVETAPTPADLARVCPVVCVMVTGPEAVDDVLFGPDGWATGAQPGHRVVQMSTIGPYVTHTVGDRLAEQGIRLVDAPVSGSVQVAKAAELVILAGGDADDLAAVGPLLEAMSRRVIHAGPIGTGSALKLVVNSVLVTSIAAAAEALDWLRRTEPGVDAETAAAGLERVAPLAARRAGTILSEPPSAGFRVTQVIKDLELLGPSAGGVLDAVLARYRDTANGGYADHELSAVGAYVRSLG